MRAKYDVIVLGAGIAGLSVARELAKRKKEVLLLEREKIAGRTSRAAAGILDPYTEAEKKTPFLQIGLKALEFYPSFLKEITKKNVGKVEFKKSGILYLALNSKDERFLKDRSLWQKRQRIPVKILSHKEVHRMEPSISNLVRSGIYYPEIPKVNANKLTEALLNAARSAGVEIHTPIEKISVWIEGKRVCGVKIRDKKIHSETVVLAPGSWAGVDKKLGTRIRVRPVRGQILILKSNSKFRPRHILHTLRYVYIVPWPNNCLLVGSTLESVGFKNLVTSKGKRDILNRASEISKILPRLPIKTSWAGLRPQAQCGKPLVGPTHVKGLFLASGYYRSGILIAPLAGKLLAEGILTGKFSALLKPFYPEKKGGVL